MPPGPNCGSIAADGIEEEIDRAAAKVADKQAAFNALERKIVVLAIWNAAVYALSYIFGLKGLSTISIVYQMFEMCSQAVALFHLAYMIYKNANIDILCGLCKSFRAVNMALASILVFFADLYGCYRYTLLLIDSNSAVGANSFAYATQKIVGPFFSSFMYVASCWFLVMYEDAVTLAASSKMFLIGGTVWVLLTFMNWKNSFLYTSDEDNGVLAHFQAFDVTAQGTRRQGMEKFLTFLCVALYQAKTDHQRKYYRNIQQSRLLTDSGALSTRSCSDSEKSDAMQRSAIWSLAMEVPEILFILGFGGVMVLLYTALVVVPESWSVTIGFLVCFACYEVAALAFIYRQCSVRLFCMLARQFKVVLAVLSLLVLLLCDLAWLFHFHKEQPVRTSVVSFCRTLSFLTAVVVVIALDSSPVVPRWLCLVYIVGVMTLALVNVVLTLVVWDRFVLFTFGGTDITINDYYLSAYYQLIMILAAAVMVLFSDVRSGGVHPHSYLIQGKLERSWQDVGHGGRVPVPLSVLAAHNGEQSAQAEIAAVAETAEAADDCEEQSGTGQKMKDQNTKDKTSKSSSGFRSMFSSKKSKPKIASEQLDVPLLIAANEGAGSSASV
jgi:hypothetical protein